MPRFTSWLANTGCGERGHFGSGLDMLAEVLKGFSDPLAILDSFLCLMAVGVLLGVVRLVTGNIAACIGLHAGWVAVIYVVRETTRQTRRHRRPG